MSRPLPNVSQYRHGHSGKLFVFGGEIERAPSASVEMFDFSAGPKWLEIAPMSTARWRFGAATVGNKIYVIGGSHEKFDRVQSGILNTMEALDVDRLEWENCPPMTIPRHGHAVVSEGHLIYVVGGDNGERQLDSMEVYNCQTGEWQSGPPMMTPRRCLSLVIIGRKIYAIGGLENTEPSATTEVFDILGGTWQKMPDMPTARGIAATTVYNRQVYVFGGTSIVGRNASEGEDFKSIEVFDPITVKWQIPEALPDSRCSACGITFGHEVWLIGGLDGKNQKVKNTAIFDLETKLWEELYPMNYGRTHFAAASHGVRVIDPGSVSEKALKSSSCNVCCTSTNLSNESSGSCVLG